jgi:signal peptidase II
MWKKIIGITLPIVIIDQVTKIWIYHTYVRPIKVIGDFLKITLILNPYGVFGIRLKIPFLPLTVVGVCVLIVILWKYNDPLFALILGGAIGTLIDRIRIKKVIDWIDIGIGELRWPVFNLADAAITIGIIWLIIRELIKGKKKNINESL